MKTPLLLHLILLFFGFRPHLLVAFILTAMPALLQGQVIVRDSSQKDDPSPTKIWLPYVFYSETFDLALGFGGVVSGLWQEQMTLYATAFLTNNDSSRIWAGAYDIRLPGSKRLFLSPEVVYTDYSQVRAYIGGNPNFPNQQSGSNDSHPDNFVTGKAKDTAIRLGFRYVLPVGDGETQVTNRYTTKNGLLHNPKSGTKGWNPQESGRSYLLFEQFYRDQRIDFDTGSRSLRSNGLKIGLMHDNTDFTLNPSSGSRQILILARDFGIGKSDGTWTRWQFGYSKFVSLGETGWAQQQVLAFNFWVSDTPTWRTEVGDDGFVRATHRPPYYDEASLGGIGRMRAYPENRFNDRSAIYYGLEYRFIPRWNPLSRISFAGIPKIDWWQWVAFIETGRVAGDFDLSELHRDLKLDLGVGLRAYSEGLVGRLDFAFSDEGWAAVAMVGHPF